MKLTQGLQGRKIYYTWWHTKALKIIIRVGADYLRRFLQGSKSYSVVVSHKSQSTVVLLMQRNEIHQGPVSICPGQSHTETWCCDTERLTETWPWQWPLHGDREREATGNCALDGDFLGGNWGNHSTISVEPSYSWTGFLPLSDLLLVKHCQRT